MKRIWNDLTHHIRTDFDNRSYGIISSILAVLIFINYYFKVEEDVLAYMSHIDYQLTFLVAYPALFALFVWIKSGKKAFENKVFLLSAGFFLLLLSLNSGFLWHRDWVSDLPRFERYFLRNILVNSIGLVIVFVPLIPWYLKVDRLEIDSFYGLSLKRHNFRPYIVLLLLMVPLIYSATYSADFLQSYPVFKVWKYKEVFGLTRTQMMTIFESIYLFDFIRVEVLFRGLLVIGLARFLGKDTVIVMAAMYCVLHFNKPLGETISSFFGGYLLGTIALYQRNIVGGCLVHMGIAGLMDLFAYFTHMQAAA